MVQNTMGLRVTGYGRALSALSRDLYSGAGAVLAELMQNADDSRFPAGALPTLRIRLEQGTRSLGLLVEVNECGFSESDVRAICDLGASAKVREGAAAATGRKGLGFKSVFAICETAYLRSNGFSFRFVGRELKNTWHRRNFSFNSAS